MSACETCWDEAFRRSRMLGGSQVDHYQRLMQGRFETHPQPTPTPDETTESEGSR